MRRRTRKPFADLDRKLGRQSSARIFLDMLGRL